MKHMKNSRIWKIIIIIIKYVKFLKVRELIFYYVVGVLQYLVLHVLVLWHLFPYMLFFFFGQIIKSKGQESSDFINELQMLITSGTWQALINFRVNEEMNSMSFSQPVLIPKDFISIWMKLQH